MKTQRIKHRIQTASLLKYYFLSPKANIKNSFLVWLCSVCAHFLSLSCLTSLLLIWVWLCSGLCSGCGSWVVDREFVIWVSLCSMVVIRWVFGFCRAWWHDMGFAMLSIQWVFGFLGFAMLVVIWLWYRFFGFRHALWCWVGCAMSCGLVKLQRWRDRDNFFFFLQYCYSAIQYVKLHYSTIAKKFAILGFSIPWCWALWGLKCQILLTFGICIPQCWCSGWVFIYESYY